MSYYRYGFNGKEKDVNGEWGENTTNYDFGARIYNPSIGKWLSVDPMQSDYVPFSPYNFGLNSPVLFVDVDGNKVDVSTMDETTRQNLISDLSRITGLNVNYENGFLVLNENCDSNCNSIPDNELTGSKSARDYLTNLITADDIIKVSSDSKKISGTTNNKNINLNPNRIDKTKKSLKAAGEDSVIFGEGLVFLHETLHTKVGAIAWSGDKKTKPYIDPVRPSDSQAKKETAYKNKESGAVVDRINIIRRELKVTERGAYPSTGAINLKKVDKKGKVSYKDIPLKE